MVMDGHSVILVIGLVLATMMMKKMGNYVSSQHLNSRNSKNDRKSLRAIHQVGMKGYDLYSHF